MPSAIALSPQSTASAWNSLVRVRTDSAASPDFMKSIAYWPMPRAWFVFRGRLTVDMGREV